MRIKFLNVLGVFGLLLFLAVPVAAVNLSETEPVVTLSNLIPVVEREVEITLRNAGSVKGAVPLSITQEGNEVFQKKVAPAEGKIAVKWTPKQTGFYKASFSLGKRKINRDFAVVWTDMYFITWGPLKDAAMAQCEYLPAYHISGASNPDMKHVALLQSRGIKVIRYVSGAQHISSGPMSDETIDKWVAAWSAPMKQGFDGIFIDELGEYPTPELKQKLVGLHKTLVKLRKENPDMIIMPASAGALLREESIMYKYSDSVALLETYPTMFSRYFASHSIKAHIDHRIMVARNTDLLYQHGRKHGAIILLGGRVDAPHEEPITAEIEEYVRYIKKNAPEMHGIGFYGSVSADPEVNVQTQERLCRDYYIKPVVDLREIRFTNYSPRAGEAVDILALIHNLGGMDARGIKARVYAAEVGSGKKKKIGEIDIEKIACGFLDLVKKSGKEQKFEYQEVNGNKYVVTDSYNTVFLPRTTRKVTWKPAKKGYYSIIVEIEPSEQYTILDGVLEKTILVK